MVFKVFRFFVVFVKIVQKMLIFVDLLEILLGFGQCECDMHSFSAKCREFVEWWIYRFTHPLAPSAKGGGTDLFMPTRVKGGGNHRLPTCAK